MCNSSSELSNVIAGSSVTTHGSTSNVYSASNTSMHHNAVLNQTFASSEQTNSDYAGDSATPPLNNTDHFSENNSSENNSESNSGVRGCNKFEPASPPPVGGIVSDNGLQYANLDGSSNPAGYPPTSRPSPSSTIYNPIQNCGNSYQNPYDHHQDNSAAVAFSAYLESSSPYAAAAAAAAATNIPGPAGSGTYGAHSHHGFYSQVNQPKIGGNACREYMATTVGANTAAQSSYPSHHVPKPASTVPTYKWMQVKRNVPKPSKFSFYVSIYKLHF